MAHARLSRSHLARYQSAHFTCSSRNGSAQCVWRLPALLAIALCKPASSLSSQLQRSSPCRVRATLVCKHWQHALTQHAARIRLSERTHPAGFHWVLHRQLAVERFDLSGYAEAAQGAFYERAGALIAQLPAKQASCSQTQQLAMNACAGFKQCSAHHAVLGNVLSMSAASA